MHLLHLLPHRLHLLLCSRQCWIVFAVAHQLRINGLGKPLGHLLSARPVHVLDEQVTGHLPELWVALQQLSHRLQRLLALGGVAWAGGRHDIVLANAGVVDFLYDNALLVNNLVDRLWLVRVDLDHLRLAVLANDPRHALRVVNLGDQVDQLPGDVPNATGEVVAVMVRANIAFSLTR